MPSSSPAQARLMGAVAHGWSPPQGGPKVPVEVAKEFNKADQAKAQVAALRGKEKSCGCV